MELSKILVVFLVALAGVLMLRGENYRATYSCDIAQVVKDNQGQLCCDGCDDACTDNASNAACYTACNQAYPAVNCNSS